MTVKFRIAFRNYFVDLNKDDMESIDDIPFKELFSQKIPIFGETFRDEISVWIETEMIFIPPLGMQILGLICKNQKFDWSEDIPRVVDLEL